MAKYVAFLRGMNLGRRRVKNDELCECFEAMGFGDVSAFLASGNVLFSARGRRTQLENTIAKALEEHFSYEVKTFVRSAKDVTSIARQQPFDDTQLAASTGKIQVAILEKAPSTSSRTSALAFATSDDLLAIEGRELYWLPKGNMSASELDLKGLATQLGIMTIRTQRTLTRLATKLAS